MENKKRICIHHSIDLDGWGSGVIVKEAYKKLNKEIEILGWNYGQDIPDLSDYDFIIMCDISFPQEVMLDLISKNKRIIWIDHHASAIKESVDNGYDDLEGIRNDEYAACELTWQFFYKSIDAPKAITLLGLYDSFRGLDTENWISEILPFQYAMRGMINSVDSFPLELLRTDVDDEMITGIIEDGRVIFQYLQFEAQDIFNTMGMPCEIEGHKAIIFNKDRFNPNVFQIDYHAKGYEIAGCFGYKDGSYSWSLYNEDGSVDCSVICKKFGGGGHPGAAGFRSDEIKFGL